MTVCLGPIKQLLASAFPQFLGFKSYLLALVIISSPLISIGATASADSSAAVKKSNAAKKISRKKMLSQKTLKKSTVKKTITKQIKKPVRVTPPAAAKNMKFAPATYLGTSYGVKPQNTQTAGDSAGQATELLPTSKTGLKPGAQASKKIGIGAGAGMATAVGTSTAASSAAVLATKAPVQENKESKIFSASFSVGRSDRLYQSEEADSNPSTDFSLGMSLKLSQNYSLGFSTEYSQDEKSAEEDFGRTSLSLRHSKIDIFSNHVGWLPSAAVGVPFDSKRARDASLQSSVSVASKFAANPEYLFSKRLSLDFHVSANKNFHQYDTADYSGRVNTEYGAIEGLGLGWQLFERLSFSVEANHFHTWSYQNTYRDFFGHTEELSLNLTDNLAISGGHTIERAPTRKLNGEDLNINATDELSSMVYGQITVTF